MSDVPFTFTPAPTKPSAGQQAAGRTPRTEPIPDAPKRKRRTAAELAAAAPAEPIKRRRRKRVEPDTAILTACVKYLRTADDAARIVAMLRIMFE